MIDWHVKLHLNIKSARLLHESKPHSIASLRFIIQLENEIKSNWNCDYTKHIKREMVNYEDDLHWYSFALLSVSVYSTI